MKFSGSTKGIPLASTSTSTCMERPSRKKKTKFVGRMISHRWCTDEAKQSYQWYQGTILECTKGMDGSIGAEYEIRYNGDRKLYRVDNLQEDFDAGTLKFIDV